MNNIQEISAFYDSETDKYDDGYSDLICLAEDALVTSVLEPIMGQRVLDVGCGTGLLLSMVEPPEYVGVEISHKMADKAKIKYPERLFVQADQAKLPLPDQAFDTVFSLYGPFSYSLTPAELLLEFDRVLKPGGTFAIMPYTLRVQHNLAVGAYSTATETTIPKLFYTTQMIRDLFDRFENVEIQGINYFGNTYLEFAQTMAINDPNLETLITLLRAEKELAAAIPVEFARHSIVTGQKAA